MGTVLAHRARARHFTERVTGTTAVNPTLPLILNFIFAGRYRTDALGEFANTVEAPAIPVFTHARTPCKARVADGTSAVDVALVLVEHTVIARGFLTEPIGTFQARAVLMIGARVAGNADTAI